MDDVRTDLHGLVGRWIEGWVRCRPGSGARSVTGGWEVAVVGSEKRHVETVLVEPHASDLDAYAAGAAAEPGRWLSVVTHHPWPGPAPDGLQLVLDRERLMTTVLAPGAEMAAPRDVRRDASAVRCRVTVLDDDVPAARGTVGVVGDVAVFDQIGTEPAVRRRGHGRRLMAALTDWALEQGAVDGVLMASVDGQALYRRLGWDPAACLATFSAPTPGG